MNNDFGLKQIIAEKQVLWSVFTQVSGGHLGLPQK